MTAATVDTPIAPITPPPARPAAVGRSYRFELVKLVSQWRIRILFLACLVGPAGFVAVVSQQSSLPADTVFGRWMHDSGWAGPLVVLSFSCSWVLPLLTSLVAGDVFAAEDRLGTWRHLLVTVRSPRRIFLAKSTASLTVILVLVVALGASAVAGGVLAVGHQPLIGLDGHTFGSGSAARVVVLAWLCALAPTLAFAGVGLLGSVLFGRSPMGLVTPALLAVLLDVAQMLPLPVVVRTALPSWGFLAWRGLFTQPAQAGPILTATLVGLVWAVVATALAYLAFVRRDFTTTGHDGAGRRAIAVAVLPLLAVFGACVAATAAATPAHGSGIDRAKLDRSLAVSFGHLYRLQEAELNRPAVTEIQLRTSAACDKGGPQVDDSGPGNDWRCVVYWHIPGASAVGQANYQLDVSPDGRYVADGDGPLSVNGFFQVHTPSGDEPNPLWQFDGLVDLVNAAPKG